MGKVILFILGAYVVYYAVNIFYDLFLAKAKTVASQDEGQLVSITSKDDEPPDIRSFNVEDVEDVEVPQSYVVDEEVLYDDSDTPTNYDAEAFRTNYEEERELETYDSQSEKQLLEQENQEKKLFVSHLLNGIKTPTENFISTTKEVISNAWDTDKFDDFLNIANSHVVLTSNIDGHKVFKSTL